MGNLYVQKFDELEHMRSRLRIRTTYRLDMASKPETYDRSVRYNLESLYLKLRERPRYLAMVAFNPPLWMLVLPLCDLHLCSHTDLTLHQGHVSEHERYVMTLRTEKLAR